MVFLVTDVYVFLPFLRVNFTDNPEIPNFLLALDVIDEAKKSYADACERCNGLVAEYYEGVIDTLSDIINSLGTKDE